MMDKLRRFIKVDNYESVKIGDTERTSDFPEAAVREGAG